MFSGNVKIRRSLRIETAAAAHNFLMKNTTNWETGIKIAKLSGIVAAVYLGMRFIFPIVLPFLLALVLARFLYPLACRIQRRFSVKKTSARALTYGIFLLLAAGIVAAILAVCYWMGGSCLEYIRYVTGCVRELFGTCCENLERISGMELGQIQKTIQNSSQNWGSGAVRYSKDAGWYLVSLLAKIFVAIVAAFLMLNEYEAIMAGMNKNPAGKHALDLLREIKMAAGAYLRAQCMILGAVSLICIVGLTVLGIRGSFWIGLAVGLCDALPFVGTGTVFVPWALIALLSGRYQRAGGLMLIYLICSFLRQMLEPRLVGKKLGIPPLAVLMSIYIGIQVYGGAGIITGPISALILYELLCRDSFSEKKDCGNKIRQ